MKHSVIRAVMTGVLTLLLCAGIGSAAGNQATGSSDQSFKTEHVWDAKVAIGDRISVGASKNGERHIVPIPGGTFKVWNLKSAVYSGIPRIDRFISVLAMSTLY